MSHVDVKNLKPSKFEEDHFDEYEYYNLSDKYTGTAASPVLLWLCPPLTWLGVCVLQRVRPGKAEPRRRPVRTQTDTVLQDTRGRSWRSFKTATRRPRSEA